MKYKLFALAAIVLAMTSCNQRKNPFLTEWDTPYGIPPFDKIQYEDYIPAIKEGIAQQDAVIKSIVDNPDAPTFANTIEPYEYSSALLDKVEAILGNLSESDGSKEFDAILEQEAPLMSEHSSNIMMNKAFFDRVAAVYNADQSDLTREQQMVLKNLYDSFIHNGVNLPEDAQARLREVNTKIALLSQKLGNNLLAESNNFKKEFGISVSDYPAAMTTTEDRALREKMFKAYSSRGHNGNEYDNRQLFLDLMKLRIEKANIMGYDNFADYELSEKMAHDHQTVDTFLGQIMDASMQKAKEEVYDMQQIMDQDVAAGKLPQGSRIEPWDWFYYAEKVRLAKYALDENQTKPYFELGHVRDGVFAAADTLYGIHFEAIQDVPVYNPEVQTFVLTDKADGSLIGVFMGDYFPRDSKKGGAWMTNFRGQQVDQQGNDIRPIIANVCNLTPVNDEGVSLLTVDNVITMFHEFGHALHGFLTKCHYPSVSGTNTKQDFVETFSQFNENWAFQPELLKKYARHYKTGEVIPDSLVAKIKNASYFNQGFEMGELTAAAILDMKWHELSEIPADATPDFIDEFESKVCSEMGLVDEIIPRYRTTYFNHIFSDGYAAGYYGYEWSEVIEQDAFAYFVEHGVWDLDLAKSFKETFLEKGGSEEPMTLYISWRGQAPTTDAILRAHGLE